MNTTRTKRIRAWMALNGVAPKAVAAANNVSLRAVHRFIKGDMTSANLSSWFVAQGCPAARVVARIHKATRTRRAA